MTAEEKRCGKCKTKKPFDQFYKNRAAKDGYQYSCKDCQKKYWPSEKGKESNRRYQKSAKGKITRQKSSAKYYRTEKGKKTRKKYNQSDKAKAAVKRAQAKFTLLGGSAKLARVRRTRESQAGGTHTTDEWYNLCKFYGFNCLRCMQRFSFNELTADHITPISKGGVSFIWNLQPLCKPCNSKKGTTQIDYRKSLPDWINRDGLVWQQDTLF